MPGKSILQLTDNNTTIKRFSIEEMSLEQEAEGSNAMALSESMANFATVKLSRGVYFICSSSGNTYILSGLTR